MPKVVHREGEPFDITLRRFKRAVEKSGVLADYRRKERYVKPTTLRQQQKAAAVKRAMKRTFKRRDANRRNTVRRITVAEGYLSNT